MNTKTKTKTLTGAAAALVAGGSVVGLTAAPAGAHETSVQVGGAVGTVGENHSGARLCEISDGPGYAEMWLILANGEAGYLLAADGCQTDQYGDVGGVVRYQVGWDQG